MKTVNILVVKSRHGEHLESVVTGLSHCLYDPVSRPAFYCISFWIRRLFFVRAAPKEARTLIAISQTLRVRGVIATDAYRSLLLAEKFLPKVNLYWIQHGLYLDQQSFHLKREVDLPSRPTSIVLFAVSPYDRDHFNRWGAKPKRIIPVGTIKNGYYVSNVARQTHCPNSKFDICIVEKGIKPFPDSELGVLRRDGWRDFLEQFSDYCQISKPRVVVALSPSDSQPEVAKWIRQHLRYDFEFAAWNDEFSTYRAVDESELTVGQTSTVLSEALSRKRKCLALNYADVPFWNLPGKGISQLVKPDFEQLTTRLDELRNMSWEMYWSKVPEDLKRLVVPDPGNTLSLINETLKTGLLRQTGGSG